MPHHFLHRAGGGVMPDTGGTDLPDLEMAHVEAVQFAAETVRDHPQLVWDGKDFRVEVTDDAGMLPCTVVVLGIEAPAVRGALTRSGA